MYLNEATLLQNVRLRYKNELIYVSQSNKAMRAVDLNTNPEQGMSVQLPTLNAQSF